METVGSSKYVVNQPFNDLLNDASCLIRLLVKWVSVINYNVYTGHKYRLDCLGLDTNTVVYLMIKFN